MWGGGVGGGGDGEAAADGLGIGGEIVDVVGEVAALVCLYAGRGEGGEGGGLFDSQAAVLPELLEALADLVVDVPTEGGFFFWCHNIVVLLCWYFLAVGVLFVIPAVEAVVVAHAGAVGSYIHAAAVGVVAWPELRAAHDGVQVARVGVSVVPAVGWVHLMPGIIAAKIFVRVGLNELAAFLDICNFIFHCLGGFWLVGLFAEA